MNRYKSARQGGFTVIELVMVIVILGVLAAVALPRFVNLGTDARIAAVKSASGAIVTAANNAMIKCQTVPGCFVALQGSALTGPGGVSNHMYNGFPTGRTRVNAYFGIKDWVQISGFTLAEFPSNYTEYTLDGAPDPANCKVKYVEAWPFGSPPTVTITTSGC